MIALSNIFPKLYNNDIGQKSDGLSIDFDFSNGMDIVEALAMFSYRNYYIAL